MTSEELLNVVGGKSTFNASALNAVSRFINTILDFGRIVGTIINSLVKAK